jgi:large subunit ribosomal protein L4
MRRLALLSALSVRAAEGHVVVVDSFDWDTPRTKAAVQLIEALAPSGKTLFVVAPSDEVVAKSVRNLEGARVLTAGQLNTYDVLWADTLVFTGETVTMVGARGAAADVVGEEEAEAS